MADKLKIGTTVAVSMGPFVDKADGVTPKTALTPTFRVRKFGGAFGARSSATAPTHDENGYYNCELNTTDTGTLGLLRVAATDATTYLPVWRDFDVISADDWDAEHATAVTLQAATATTATLDAGASGVDDYYKGQILTITSGTGAGQSRRIVSYVGSTKLATVDVAWATNPSAGSGFEIDAFANVSVSSNHKKNQALAKFEFLMTDSITHAPVTGKTVAVTRSIDNSAFVGGTLSAVTEIGNGIYSVDFAAADMNGNVVVLRATSSGCDDTFERVITQP